MTHHNKKNQFYSIGLLNSIYPLSTPFKNYLSKVLVRSHFLKGDFIAKKGEICDKIHIIRKGLVRGYFDYDKNEITTWVSMEDELITSISGFFRNEPALENIQCLEGTYTESLSYEDMHEALQKFPEMSQLNRILMEKYYVASEHRSFMARIPTAIDRYKYFLNFTNEELQKRLPKKYLASLLNVRPETLSRLNLTQLETVKN